MENDIKTLTDLGLTISQAKVYLASTRLRKNKAKDLAKEAGIARQELYRILTELLELGLIEKEISTPTLFKATPLSEGALLLLNKKRREVFKLEKEAKNLVVKRKGSGQVETSDSQFLILSRKYAMDGKAGESYKNSQSSIQLFCPFERLVNAFNYNGHVYEEAIRRGVDMRVITEKPDTHGYRQLKKEGAALFSHQNFWVKFVVPFKNMVYSIIDGKEVYFGLNPGQSIFLDQLLWTNNSSIIFLAQEYFSMIWSLATDVQID